MAGINRHNDAGDVFYGDRDFAGLDVRGLLHFPQLTLSPCAMMFMTCDSGANWDAIRRAVGPLPAPAARATGGGIVRTGKAGCCGVSDMFNGAPGYSKNKGAAPAGRGMPYGTGLGR